MFRWQGESRSKVPPVLEASTLTHAQRRGLFARRSPLLRFQDDANLVALTRKGHQHAFDSLVERYQSRLLGFCRQMLGSTEDAEDVLQEVFVAAYNAMVADERPIAVRPWLYRIARNRCLNHLRKPTADGQDTMDTHPHMNGVTTLERVQNREEFRNLLSDVGQLPETQRSALLLREIDAMSYEEIAQAMDTTVPGVKSLLVRARIALAESSQSRQLTCDEVRLELAEAAEGIAKVSGPARRHLKACDPCREFRTQLRSDTKALAAIFPAGPLLILKGALLAKLSGIFGGGGGGAAAGAGGGGGAAAGAGAGAGAWCGGSRGGRRWCRSGRCRGRSRCGSCRSGRCGGREHGRDRRCRGSRRCGRRWRSRNCGRCCGRDRDEGGCRARHGGDHRRRGRGDPERLGPSSGKQAAAVEDAADPQDSTRHSGEGRTHPGGDPAGHTRDDTSSRRHHAAARHCHGPAPDDRSHRVDRLADRWHHSLRNRQAQAPQARGGQQRLPAHSSGADRSGHDRG